MKSVVIYSDGACQGNPGPGGWAAVLRYKEKQAEISGHAIATTNNRMELQGAIEALNKLKEPCDIQFFTDSEYLRNGITQWIHAWKKKRWMKGKDPVKNSDLWKLLDQAVARHSIKWNWVRGHSGEAMNERCDVLAVAEIEKLRAHVSKEELKKALTDLKQNGHPQTL
ncbi:MAG: ribonuclease [Verrucomicrobiales bacterium]|nr:ribonuclease [Verrucomicrobiales bacterium]